ncbi:MAG TPA: DUF2149 domain-containing protein [Capillimicrobium sp.]|nr:DUF2149 domain-containing protein [Capillimicrobium sp.]
MTSRVSSRARMREDRAGDPLAGMVNLFDLGLVLALAFLLVAINSLGREQNRAPDAVVAGPDEQVGTVPQEGERVIGRGEEVGKVYRLDDGRLVYVAPKEP